MGERDNPHGNNQVVDVRPSGQGGAVPRDAIVTLVSGVPVSSEGLAERFLVSENGVLKSGSIQLRADDRIVEFVASAPFQPGAFVQVFLRERLNARDSQYPIELGAFVSGVQFYVEGGFETFQVIAVTPTNSFEGAPATIRPRVLLSSPALPSSVNASTVVLQDWTGPVAGTVHLLGGGEIIEFRPAQNLTAGQGYSLTLSGVQSLTGEMLAGDPLPHFNVRADSDTTPPQILAVTPADGATSVPLNTWIRVGFSEQLSRSARTEDLQLFGMGRSWAIDSVRLDNGPSLSFKPLEALRPNTLYTATFSGGSDPSGLSSGPITWTFQTGDQVDTDAAKLLPQYDPAVNLTPTSPIQLTFDKPADLVDFAGVALLRQGIDDLWTGAWSRSADGMTAIFIPDQPLPVGSTLTVPNGRSFSIGFTPDITPPAIVSTSIPNGAKNISPFAQIVLTLSEGIDPRTVNPTNVRLFDGSTQLPLHIELSDKDGAPYDQWEIITARCVCALELGRTYRGELSGIRDLFGNVIAPYQLKFTTRAVYEFTPPRFTFNLQGQREIFRTVTGRIRANEPLNPATVNAQTVFYRIGDQDLPGTVGLEADGKTIRVTPLQPLPAHTEIYVVVTQGVQDAAGNPPEYEFIANFRTGTAEFDVEPPVVAWVQPPDGATGVPVNTIPFVRFSEDFDQFSGYPSYRLLAPGGVHVSTGDGQLLPNTTYTIDVEAVGVDFAGLPFAGAQFSFTTGASSVPDLTPPSLISSNPAQDAMDVPVDTSIELVFSEPVVVTSASVGVDTGYSGPSVPLQIIPGADPTRVSLQLPELLAPNTAYRVSFDGFDLASQPISAGPGPSSIAFQTSSSSPDMTGPRVLTINPPDGATDVAMANAVIEFDKALDPSTVNDGSIRMFVNGEPISHYVGYAGYGSTVHISAHHSAPDNSLITVAVSSTLKDLVGNPAEPFVARFRMGVRQETANPMVSAVRPDTGQLNVSPDSSFHLFLTDPIDPTSAQAATLASENGALISGSVNVSSNNQVLTFTPDRPYVDGAEVRLFVDLRLLQRESGGQFGYYLWESWYWVGTQPFQMTSGDLSGVRPRNTRFVMRFSEPLDPSTVSDQSFRVLLNPSGVGVPASVQLEQGGRQVRVTPQQLLDADEFYEIRVEETVRSAGGASLAGPISGQFRASDQTASMASMAKLSPPDGVTGVGVNGSILALLGDDIDSGTVNEQTLTWTDGVQVYRPSTVRFVQWSGPEQRVATVTPEAPFAPSTSYTVTLAGAEDLAGNPVPTATTTFTTGPAPDLVGPRLLRWAPLDSAAPRNSAITLEFDEPVDPLTLAVGIAAAEPGPTFTQVISDGGRVVTFLPDGLLDPAARYDVALYRSARDLSGNPVAGDPVIVFFTVSDEVVAPPLGVKAALPVAGATNVPIDSRVVVQFDREIRPGSLDPARIRMEQGGAAIPIRIEITGRGDMIELIPVGLFDPLTPYNWTVDGLVDLAGNPLAVPLTGDFSTGAEADANGPSLVSITPADGAGGVGLNAQWVLVFDQPLHPGRSSFSLGPYSNAPDQSSLSADGKTWTISRDEPWPAQTLLQINAHAAGLNGVSVIYSASATTGN